MSRSLKHKVFRATLWSAIQRYSCQFLQLAISLALTRLLTPAEYGLIGLVNVFIMIFNAVIESGFGEIIIREHNLDGNDKATMFTFNTSCGLLFVLILFFIAPYVAQFYSKPEITIIIRCLSFTVLFKSLGLTHWALLRKEYKFHIIGISTILSLVLSGVIALTMALREPNVWVLVVFSLTMTFTSSLLYILFGEKFGFFAWKQTFIRKICRLGSLLALSSVMAQVFDCNIYSLVIGKYYSPANVGYFTRANSLQRMPYSSLGAIFADVLYPLFSKLRNNNDKMKMAYIFFFECASLFALPVAVCVFSLAGPFVELVLGEKWIDIIPVLKIICLSSVMYTYAVINYMYFKAMGLGKTILLIQVSRYIVVLLSVFVCARYGMRTMLWAFVGNSVFYYVLTVYCLNRTIKFGVIEHINATWKGLLISLVLLFVFLISDKLFAYDQFKLFLLLPVGGVTYFMLILLICRSQAKEFLSLIRNR